MSFISFCKKFIGSVHWKYLLLLIVLDQNANAICVALRKHPGAHDIAFALLFAPCISLIILVVVFIQRLLKQYVG